MNGPTNFLLILIIAVACTASSSNQQCETPTDLIFVVDGRDEFEYRSSLFIQQMAARIPYIGRYASAVSVFTSGTGNSAGVILPGQSWPMGALIFNTTNTGALSCSLNPTSKNFLLPFLFKNS